MKKGQVKMKEKEYCTEERMIVDGGIEYGGTTESEGVVYGATEGAADVYEEANKGDRVVYGETSEGEEEERK